MDVMMFFIQKNVILQRAKVVRLNSIETMFFACTNQQNLFTRFNNIYAVLNTYRCIYMYEQWRTVYTTTW